MCSSDLVAEANAYALAANHTSDLGTYDEAELLAMMQETQIDPALWEATSYTEGDLLDAQRWVDMASGSTLDPMAEWAGMPEFKQDNLMSKFHVVVHFATDEARDDFFKTIGRESHPSMWWPAYDGLVTSDRSEQFVEG